MITFKCNKCKREWDATGKTEWGLEKEETNEPITVKVSYENPDDRKRAQDEESHRAIMRSIKGSFNGGFRPEKFCRKCQDEIDTARKEAADKAEAEIVKAL